jgi:hypothetical protein
MSEAGDALVSEHIEESAAMRVEKFRHLPQSPLDLLVDLGWHQPHESCGEVGE